jgi:hypothetical protein
MLWQQHPVEHEVAATTVASLQRGGPKLLLAAGTFNSCGGVEPAGRPAFRADASHRPTVILSAQSLISLRHCRQSIISSAAR